MAPYDRSPSSHLGGRKSQNLSDCSKRYFMLWEFENSILRRIFGLKRNKNGEWRRLQNEELHSLYRLPNIARAIKTRRLRWAGHVARMKESRSAFKMLAVNLQERDH